MAVECERASRMNSMYSDPRSQSSQAKSNRLAMAIDFLEQPSADLEVARDSTWS